MHSGAISPNRQLLPFTHSLSLDNPASSDSYLKTKVVISIVNLGLTLIYLALLTFSSLKDPFISISSVAKNIYLQFLIFTFSIEVVFALVKFPLDYFAGFTIEHRFNLSTETFRKWLFRKLKAALVGSVLGAALLIVFFFLLVRYPGRWWLLFAAFYFLFQIAVAQLFPSVILPMFYKLKPLSDNLLHDRLRALVERFGYKMAGVFSFDLSRETRKANAAMTGLGKARKIIISDTLIENFSAGEIEVVMAHELGHLVKHHMIKGICVSGITGLVGFYVMARIYAGYASALTVPLSSLTAIPFLALLLTIFGIIAMPFGNFLSRRIEHEADVFAIANTGMRTEFAESMRKLGKLNLTPENPPAWIEKIFFSHPSIGARIKAALSEESDRPEDLTETAR